MEKSHEFGRAPIDMRVCRKCVNGDVKHAVPVIGTHIEIEKFSSWCTKAMCPGCAHQWYVCRECTGIRSQIDTKTKLRTHDWRYHGNGAKKREHQFAIVNQTNKRKARKTVSRVGGSKPTLDSTPTSKSESTGRTNIPRQAQSHQSSTESEGSSTYKAKPLAKKGKIGTRLVQSSTESKGSSTSNSEPLAKKGKGSKRLIFSEEPITVSAPPSIIEVTDTNDIDQFPYDGNYSISSKEDTPSRLYGGCPTTIRACEFSRDESTNYYAHNFHKREGIAYLISRSFYNNNISPDDIPTDDLDMCLKLTMLVKTLSVNQSDLLGDFLKLLLERVDLMDEQWKEEKYNLEKKTYCPYCRCKSCVRMGSSELSCGHGQRIPVLIPPIPSNALQIRNVIREGSRAFLSLLPHPLIRQSEDGHSYVLPSDCILHFLANGNLPMEFDTKETNYPIREFRDTPRGVSISKSLSKVTDGRKSGRGHFNISFLEWKDDCESAKSNRQSKFSIWVFTITIFRRYSKRDSPIGTYAVALGPKGKNHDQIEKIIADDINKMRTNAINAVLGWSEMGSPRSCTFSADLFMSLGDQPERRGANALQLGSSRHHARWRHACNHALLVPVLPSCSSCFDEMIKCDSYVSRNDSQYDKRTWTKLNCNDCTNWSFDLCNPLLQFDRSAGFPQTHILGGEEGDGRLSPMVLTYEVLEKVINLTFKMVSEGKWTKVMGVTYLCDNCVNDNYAQRAVSRAINVWNMNNAKEEGSDLPRYREFLRDQSFNPAKYIPLEIPSVFNRGLSLRCYSDTPMHLLLLGCCKTVFRRLGVWASRRGRKREFLLLASSLLTKLDDMKLSWLLFVPKTFSKKWGGWVSKNYASLLRVALWVYGPLMAIDDAPPYEDPVGDPMKWTVPLLQDWLKARGLDASGNKPVLQPRVVNLLRGPPENIPAIQPNLYGSAADMMAMIKSMVIMVTTLFQEDVHQNTPHILELRIRIFLSRFQKFDQPMKTKLQKPTWLSSYNFLSLLNLPGAVEEFGPLRKWFEGKWQGERFVTSVKNERRRCPPANLYSVLLRNLHRSKSMDCLTADHYSSDNVTTNDANVIISSSEQYLENEYNTREILSIVVLECGSVGCPFYALGRNVGKSIDLRMMVRSDLAPNNKSNDGLRYWMYQLTDEVRQMNDVNVVDYGVLLPRLGSDLVGVYTKSTKNWSTEMFDDYDFYLESQNYGSIPTLAVHHEIQNHNLKREEDGWI